MIVCFIQNDLRAFCVSYSLDFHLFRIFFEFTFFWQSNFFDNQIFHSQVSLFLSVSEVLFKDWLFGLWENSKNIFCQVFFVFRIPKLTQENIFIFWELKARNVLQSIQNQGIFKENFLLARWRRTKNSHPSRS